MCVCLPEPIAIAARPDGPLRLSAEEMRALADLPPTLPARDDDPAWDAWFEASRKWNEASGRPCCRKCGGLLGRDEVAILRRGWCSCCETNWLEERVIIPLINRLGRKGALKRLRRLAR